MQDASIFLLVQSGSTSLMRIIGKKFNYDHGVEVVKNCKNKI